MQVTRSAMRIPGVSAIVLVAGASLAAAQPRHEENTGRVSYKEPRPAQNAPDNSGWVQLATPTPASHGTEFIVVGKEAGKFAQVRINASTGRVAVRKVKIYFEDGKQKVVQVDKILDAHRKGAHVIELDAPRAIDRIVVTTEPSHGSYAIYGTAGTGGVARK